MTRSEYVRRASAALDEGRINEETYDAMIMNTDIFCDEDDEDDEDDKHVSNLPDTYAEIDYDDFSDPEAILGARFDDMNYARYMER